MKDPRVALIATLLLLSACGGDTPARFIDGEQRSEYRLVQIDEYAIDPDTGEEERLFEQVRIFNADNEEAEYTVYKVSENPSQERVSANLQFTYRSDAPEQMEQLVLERYAMPDAGDESYIYQRNTYIEAPYDRGKVIGSVNIEEHFEESGALSELLLFAGGRTFDTDAQVALNITTKIPDDAIQALQEAAASETSVVIDGNNLIVGEMQFPLDQNITHIEEYTWLEGQLQSSIQWTRNRERIEMTTDYEYDDVGRLSRMDIHYPANNGITSHRFDYSTEGEAIQYIDAKEAGESVSRRRIELHYEPAECGPGMRARIRAAIVEPFNCVTW